MHPRCCRSSPLFLPFLYPSVFLSNSVNITTGFPRLPRRLNSTSPNASQRESLPGSRLNPSPDDYSTPSFADKALLALHAGPGGNGCISFLREAYLPEGPPNGGDGGHGGSVYIRAAHGETSLHKLARRRAVRAGRGRPGQGASRAGQRGEDLVLTVPVGTVVREVSREDPVAEEAMAARAKRARLKQMRREQAMRELTGDEAPPAETTEDLEAEDLERQKWLLYPGLSKSDVASMAFPRLPRRDRPLAQPASPIVLDLSRPTPHPILLAAGGVGGLGNPHFVSREYPRPTFATKGERAASVTVELELRILADVGLVGLPNAGKSTLLRAMSNSRTRVGSWAFTTLQPNIGTVVLDDYSGRAVIKSYRRYPSATTTAGAPEGEGEVEEEQRTRFTVADIPGLIEGAHLDRGLGIAFLRHVERAGVLAFVVDLGAGDAVAAVDALWREVGLYAQMREEEELDREMDARVDWDVTSDPTRATYGGSAGGGMLVADASPLAPTTTATTGTGLHIASKPWFVVATKGDLPGAEENFSRLRDYLDEITAGRRPHPSGVEDSWTANCAAIPVSAINGQGVDRVVNWVVGLLDGEP